MKSIRATAVLVLCVVAPQVVSAQGPQPAPSAVSSGFSKRSSARKKNQSRRPVAGAARLVADQRRIWTAPVRARADDANWMAPLAIFTTGLIATDRSVSWKLATSPQRRSQARGAANVGTALLAGGAGAMFLWGGAKHDDYFRDTGFLAGEAALDTVAVTSVAKLLAGRERPLDANSKGRFAVGGDSFPSEHAAVAWALASVIGHRYPGALAQFLAYGTATAVSASRVVSHDHFPSDVMVGATLGWLIGRQLYGADSERHPDAQWGTFEKAREHRARAPEDFASPYVPLDSWIYVALDRLAALGYAPAAFANLRPWTRMECARFVQQAGERLAPYNDQHSSAYHLYAGLRTELEPELERWRGAEGAEARIESVYARYTGVAGTPLADSYHFGSTIVNDYGRPYGQGGNVISGASAYASSGPLVLYVRGELQHAAALPAYSSEVQGLIGRMDLTPPQLPIHTRALDQFRLLDAYVAWKVRSMQLSVGRQSLEWGPNRSGPLMYSNNAAPMDMVRLTNTSAWTLPGPLSWLGPMRWEFFLGRMAGHHYPADPAIHGEKISLKPTPNLEFGFERTVVFHPVTASRFWKSFVSVGNKFTDVPGGPTDVGDRRGGFDFSYRIPGLRKWLTVYNDALSDDDPSPLAAPRRAMMNPGIYLSHFPKIPNLDFRAEAPFSDSPAIVHYGGRFFYWNGAYHDSYTNDGNLLGSWVGRDGHGLRLASTYWFSPRNTLQIGYREAHAAREFIRSGGRIQDFTVTASFSLRPDIDVTTAIQYERWNFPVLAPLSGPDTAASLQLVYRPNWGKLLVPHRP